MKQRVHYVSVRNEDTKYGNVDFIRGMITATLRIKCQVNDLYDTHYDKETDSWWFGVECARNMYWKFIEYMDANYCGLCTYYN